MTYWLAILFLFFGMPFMLMLSLLVARRETIAEVELVFDRRVLSRTFRTARRFGIRNLLLWTTYIAAACATVRLAGNLPCGLVLFGVVGLTMLLIRIFILSIVEPGVRHSYREHYDVNANNLQSQQDIDQISDLNL